MTGRPFISEDDLDTFEGWLRYQAVDISKMSPDEMLHWRSVFDEVMREKAALTRVGRMKLKMTPGEYHYAVAVRDGDDLWLVLWVKRSPKGSSSYSIPAPTASTCYRTARSGTLIPATISTARST